MEEKASYTHVMRQREETGAITMLCGIHAPGVGFIMVSPKRDDLKTESGIYRIVRDVSDCEILTLSEAKLNGWIASASMNRHRRQFEQVNA